MHLHHECYGEGPPLIILHGLFGSLENWRTLSKIFARTFRVFALDQRNHGRSPHSEVFNYPAMVEDLHEFLHEQGLSSTSLLGHSMGGKVAMLFAVTYPHLSDKLIVVDMAPKVYPRGHDDIFAALFSLDLHSLHTRQEADVALALSIPDVALRQFLLKNLERDACGAFRWRIALETIHRNYQELLEGIETSRPFDKPTLFIKGGNSDYIRDQDALALLSVFPRAQVVTIPAAGHWVHAEAPREFARVVTNFLA